MDAEWMHLEMIDQTTRNNSLRRILDFLRSNPHNIGCIIKRCGQQVSSKLKKAPLQSVSKENLSNALPLHLRIKVSMNILQGSFCQNWFISKLLGSKDCKALKAARIGNSGEVQKQMYDRVSLKELSSVRLVSSDALFWPIYLASSHIGRPSV